MLEDVIVAFQDFMVLVLDPAQRGRQTRVRKLWKYEEGYIRWLYRVCHPIMSDPAPIAKYKIPIPPYQEVIVEQ